MKECTAHSTHTDTEWRWPRDTYAITPNAIQFLLLLHSLNFNFCTDWGRYLLDVAHKLCMRYSPDYLPAKRRRQNVLIHRLGGRSVRIQTFAKQQCDDDNGDIFKLSINTQVCCLLPTRKVFFFICFFAWEFSGEWHCCVAPFLIRIFEFVKLRRINGMRSFSFVACGMYDKGEENTKNATQHKPSYRIMNERNKLNLLEALAGWLACYRGRRMDRIRQCRSRKIGNITRNIKFSHGNVIVTSLHFPTFIPIESRAKRA